MWVYESPEKIEANKKGKGSKDLWVSTGIVSPFILICIIFTQKIGHWNKSYVRYYAPKSWNEIIFNLPYYLIASFIIGLFFSYFVLKRSNAVDTQTVICLKCGKSKMNDNKQFCECGGKFEFLYKLKWVDDKNDKETV